MSIRGTRLPVFAIAILLACTVLLAPASAHALTRADVHQAREGVGGREGAVQPDPLRHPRPACS